MSAVAVNPYDMSLDELRQLSQGQPLPPPEPITPPSVTPNGEQPRDEQGRFIAAVPPQADPVVPPQADPAAPVEEYTATIDIGDGAGTQVFSAPTKDELLEKLIEAQTNATRKIRELSARPAPAAPAPVAPTVTTPNPDEELAISQEMLSEPTSAFRKLFEKQVGMPIDSFKTKVERLEAWERGQREESVAREWMAATPDYNAIPANGNKIGKWLELNRKEATAENLQAAYEDLSASGLLAPKAAAAPVISAVPVTPVPRSSGLSTRHSVATPPAAPVEDISKLTREQLLARAGGYQY